ncbi:MAG: anaerobic sulfatase maturase, partial [Desulfobacterales bacterium]
GPVCNLQCQYCFYLDKVNLYPKSDSLRMSPEILEQHIRHYLNEQPPDCPEVHFLWQGGEPTLMGIDFFQRAVNIQQRYAKHGIKISNSLQTNAVLIDEIWAGFLKDENFLVGVSLDGPPELHDIYRQDKNGHPTSEKVLRGLKVLQKYEVDVNILTVVNNRNSFHPKNIYEYLKSIGAHFLQFIPLVEVIDGRVSNRSVNSLQFGRFLNGVLDEWIACKDVGKIFVQHFDLMLGVVMGYPPSLCTHCRACGKGLVLEHNGDIYSCDHFVNANHKLGNIKKDTYTDVLNSCFQKKFGQKKNVGLPNDCLACEYLKFCYGGCPKDRILSTAEGEQGLNYLCGGYKVFYSYASPIFHKMAASIIY